MEMSVAAARQYEYLRRCRKSADVFGCLGLIIRVRRAPGCCRPLPDGGERAGTGRVRWR